MRRGQRILPGAALSRRRLIAGIGTAGLAAAIAAACGGGGSKESSGTSSSGETRISSTAAAASEGQPKKGGRANAVTNSSQAYLNVDPAQNGSQSAHFGNHSILMNEHLLTFDYNEPSKWMGRLALAVEQPDATTYVIKLRPDVTFSNDDQFTAESVRFGIERQDRKIKGTPFTGAIPVFPRVEVVDAQTVRLKIDKPYPDMYQDLQGPLGIPVSVKFYQSGDDPWGFAEQKLLHPVTAAPFKVKNFRPRETFDLERFDGYWGGAKYLDSINNPAIAEDATRVTLLKTGEAHLIGNVPPQDISDLLKDKNVNLDSRPGIKIEHLFYNALRAPFGPPSPKTRIFRRAMLMAIDRDAIVKNIWQGQGKVADSVLLPSQFAYKPQPLIPYDPKVAKQMLTEAGWDFNYTCKFLGTQGAFTADKAFIEASVDMLRQIGVKIDLQILADYSSFVQIVTNREPDNLAKWDMVITNLTMAPQPARRLWGIFGPDDVLSHYDNPELDALLDKQLADVNDESRKKTIEEIQRFAVDECALGPMGFQNYAIAWRKELKGVKLTSQEGWDLRDAWLDKA
jgi:peptide/nickel transport system substrate-binding protein